MSNAYSKIPEQKLFEEELLPHMDALYNFAYYLTYNKSYSSDLVQETFLKAYSFIGSYQKGTNAKAWLFKILKNSFINDYRKRTKSPNQVDYEDFILYQDSDSEHHLSGYNDLREEMFKHLIGDEILIALNSLQVDFRTIILLCDIEDFTYEEMSKILDIPIGTVRSRLHRARNILKEKLNSYAKKRGYKDKKSDKKKVSHNIKNDVIINKIKETLSKEKN